MEDHHQAQWSHVPVGYRYFYSASYSYNYDWYFHRHISYPSLYRAYVREPVGICVAEYYYYGGAYYCYIG